MEKELEEKKEGTVRVGAKVLGSNTNDNNNIPNVIHKCGLGRVKCTQTSFLPHGGGEGMKWVMPRKLTQTLKIWSSYASITGHKERWKIIPACIWWSVWKHQHRDGRLEEVVLRHLGSEDGSTVIAKNIRLSDFLRNLEIR
ncbi:hypothetical protein MTR67_043053 [Solanum verrucosum]|uniref:Uncharacterized protein n=1 Tax=Solanum verrucosum TaxID=315347 RepID=A0AAF0ZTY1_SOLVR|nr:hypothetical protein MTR67_043053 [Solanum verrucosum]